MAMLLIPLLLGVETLPENAELTALEELILEDFPKLFAEETISKGETTPLLPILPLLEELTASF